MSYFGKNIRKIRSLKIVFGSVLRKTLLKMINLGHLENIVFFQY